MTTDTPTGLVGLIERLEKGSGEDDAINKALSEIHYPPRPPEPGVNLPENFGKIAGVDPGYWGTNYTGSIDAALAFADAMVAECWIEIHWAGGSPGARRWPVVEMGRDDEGRKSQAETAPRALLIAVLRALSKDTGHD